MNRFKNKKEELNINPEDILQEAVERYGCLCNVIKYSNAKLYDSIIELLNLSGQDKLTTIYTLKSMIININIQMIARENGL